MIIQILVQGIASTTTHRLQVNDLWHFLDNNINSIIFPASDTETCIVTRSREGDQGFDSLPEHTGCNGQISLENTCSRPITKVKQ